MEFYVPGRLSHTFLPQTIARYEGPEKRDRARLIHQNSNTGPIRRAATRRPHPTMPPKRAMVPQHVPPWHAYFGTLWLQGVLPAFQPWPGEQDETCVKLDGMCSYLLGRPRSQPAILQSYRGDANPMSGQNQYGSCPLCPQRQQRPADGPA